MNIQEYISSELQKHSFCTTVQKIKRLGGGSISQAACFSTDKGDYFVKTNADPEAGRWFEAESLALERMNDAVHGFVPMPLHYSYATESSKNNTASAKPAYIVTEYVPLGRASSSHQTLQRELGRKLARLHASTADKFGFDVTSWCGTTKLENSWSTDWCQFYKTQRLQPLLKQVKGLDKDIDTLGASLCSRLEHWLGADVIGEVKPSLLHGDLWNGNWGARGSNNEQPIIFDPACYYGHYEFEFGIMKMFGGFTQTCFDAYEDALLNTALLPTTSEGKKERLIIYEAYHHLNHYAMFGGSYGDGFINLIDKLL
ncbi:Fructosamine/Ketosamine-3-kinase [Mycotypha africana]|uniref:Fructosamine/Ketosamine-3-kinase n=1 Tax=Mycotypha africana TaxID=64632 RepID=UPI002301DA27|nr:Fructosamine/Ketosamine-3-kinase [Mycotypha africana]KAI8988201.1 Fructosamine/Ketosamine-3-kinase [Mycotypha africana]